MIYEVRETDDGGPVLGTVEGENYIQAAYVAAKQFFRRPMAVRGSGWAGHPGQFSACVEFADTRGLPFHLRAET